MILPAVLLAVSIWIAPVESVGVSPKCQAALEAQDAVESLLTRQVGELKLALAARKAEAELREREAALYKVMWVESQAETARVRKAAFWSDKLMAIKWGAVGFAGGILAERVVE